MKVQVLYTSKTGNTEKIAKAIFEAIPGQKKDISELNSRSDYDMADIYFIGFWTDRGTASVEVLDYLSSLQGKKIALFGTCGMGEDPEYYKRIEENVKVFIEDGNAYLGSFMCQGKMPIQVRQKYQKMKTPENEKRINAMIQNFDKALLHPDDTDIKNAKRFVQKIFSGIMGNEE